MAQTDANGDGEDDENSPEKMGLRRTLTQGDAEIEVERVMEIEPRQLAPVIPNSQWDS